MAKISIPIAVKGKNRFDLSMSHGTTTDFGQLQVSYFLPVCPNDSLHVSIGSEARFAPLVVPTFMDCELVTRAFYVPMSAIWRPFENFYRDSKDSSAYKAMPYITNAELVQIFDPDLASKLSVECSSDQRWDFALSDGASTADPVKYCLLTEKGRLFQKLLHSLGYSINFSLADETHLSLLPLLAFARVVYDYVYPSQYLDGLSLNSYFNISSSSDYSAHFGTLSDKLDFLSKVVDLLTLPYKQDYFTASWKEINQPGLNYTSNVPSLSVTAEGTLLSSQKGVRLQPQNNNSGQSLIYNTALNFLQRAYDFVTRMNIVGTRFADQLFAEFGIGSRKSDPDMSQFIGQHIQKINVVDVTAMSAAQGQDLGDLAGKAYLQGGGNLFNFDSADEFGYIVCLSFVMPKIGYYQGRRRWVTCTENRFDWLTPEFDMQMRGCRSDELFADYKSQQEFADGMLSGGLPNNLFSFVPNYSDMKTGFDVLSGDFRVPSLSENLKPYFMLRDLPRPSETHPLALNANFLFMQQHEFDKIFAQPYTLRYPFTSQKTKPYNAVYAQAYATFAEMNLVYFEDKPLVFKVVISNVPYYFAMYFDDIDKLNVGYVPSSSVWLGLGINNIEAECYLITGQTSSSGFAFDFLGKTYYIAKLTSGYTILSSSTATNTLSEYICLVSKQDSTVFPYSTYQSFIQDMVDYIDHIYIKHHFNVTAIRGMQPISEEFMISDGGKTASVDMNGNRIV